MDRLSPFFKRNDDSYCTPNFKISDYFLSAILRRNRFKPAIILPAS